MENNRLKIVALEANPTETTFINKRATRREETQAKMERLWKQNPEQFNPLRNCIERERLDRTMNLVNEFLSLPEKIVSDLGCASGVFSRRLRDAGASVYALDISSIALAKLKEKDMQNIFPLQECLPETTLKDDTFDLVICTEVVSYLNPKDYRLFFSELSRVVKPEGFVVCSTPLDVNTEDPLIRFAKLAETEFNITKWVLSYHLLHIRFNDFFEAPSRFVRASRDPDYRHREIEKRKGFGKRWFQWNSSYILSFFWYPIKILLSPIVSLLRDNRHLMRILEKITHFLWNENGISHAMFIGQQRPLTFPLPKNEIPVEVKHKRQVWE